MKEYRLGIIGAGNMGHAIAEGAVRAGLLARAQALLCDRSAEKREADRAQGYAVTEDAAACVFYPLEAKTERRAMTVTVTGRQKLVLGTKVVTDAKKSWRLRFRHAAGRLFLTGVEEASAD